MAKARHISGPRRGPTTGVLLPMVEGSLTLGLKGALPQLVKPPWDGRGCSWTEGAGRQAIKKKM